MTLSPPEAAAAMASLDRDSGIVIEDQGKLERFESYDEIIVQGAKVCEEREKVAHGTCDEGKRFSENCVSHDGPRVETHSVCKTRRETFQRPFTWSYEDGDLSVSQRQERQFFDEQELSRITIREYTPSRVGFSAGIAVLLAGAITTGGYFYMESARAQADTESDGSSSLLFPLLVGLGVGAASLSLTVPLTSPEVTEHGSED